PYMSPRQFYRERRELYPLPPQTFVKGSPLIQGHASSLPVEARERLCGHLRVMAEIGAYPRAGDPTGGPTARGANNPHLPTNTWGDEAEQPEEVPNSSRGWRVTKWDDGADGDENERLAWKAVRWAQRLAAEKFGA